MNAIPAALVLVSATTCLGAPPDPPPDCSLTVELGHDVDGGFATFASGEPVPIVHGFQGFRFVQVTARLAGAPEASGSFSFDVSPEGVDPVSIAGARVPLRRGPDGASYADDLQVFLNDYPEGTLFGLTTQLDAHARSGSCAGDASALVTLVDGRCVADGGFDCGAADGGSP